jgi:hypothetical protein
MRNELSDLDINPLPVWLAALPASCVPKGLKTISSSASCADPPESMPNSELCGDGRDGLVGVFVVLILDVW